MKWTIYAGILIPFWRCEVSLQDEESVKGMACLFVEMGDAYARMIATGMHKSSLAFFDNTLL